MHLMALWLAFAAAAAAVAHGAHAAVQNEAPSAGIFETERRRLDTTQYETTVETETGSKVIRTCIGCGGSSGSGLGYTKQYKDRNGCDDGFNIWVPGTYDEADTYPRGSRKTLPRGDIRG
jgi:hypothetical protein